MKRRKYQRRFHMRKEYTLYVGSDDGIMLGSDTHKLSMIAAKFDVCYIGPRTVEVMVRCNEGSKAYKLCEKLGFDWK